MTTISAECGRCRALLAVVEERAPDGPPLDVFPVVRRDKDRANDGAGMDGLTPLGRIRAQHNGYGRPRRPVMSRLMRTAKPLPAGANLAPACGCPGPPVPVEVVRKLANRAAREGRGACTIPRR